MGYTIRGMQAMSVQACAKHFILNEQQTSRTSMSSNIDDRTFHELYLWPFAEAIQSNVNVIMCSANKVNGTWACENKRLLTDIIRGELGFRGYIISDWDAHHDRRQSIEAGLDMSIPGSDASGRNVLFGDALLKAVESGEIHIDYLNDMARRVLTSWHYVGQEKDFPSITIDKPLGDRLRLVNDRTASDAFKFGIVLLKNEGSLLPFSRVFDHDLFPEFTSNLQSLAAHHDKKVMLNLVHSRESDAIRSGNSTILLSLKTQHWGFGVSIVQLVADMPSEMGDTGDRTSLRLSRGSIALVKAMAEVTENIILVIYSPGPIALEGISDHPSVKAVIWAGMSSADSSSLGDILWGLFSPVGRLPFTIAHNVEDYNTAVLTGDDEFSEGLFIDYRHFDRSDIIPAYPFGHGLTYTTYRYNELKIDHWVTAGPAIGVTLPGGRLDLWKLVARITCKITNIGDTMGRETLQLYIGLPRNIPNTPIRQLRGFDKVTLNPGETNIGSFQLKRRDLSYWDVKSQNWIVPRGTIDVWIGSSSRDLRVHGIIQAI
ncbi:hypothetical protein TD95_002622 [Thielaviopsis punctulata]|uniref:beta-glucosidase n=1 Tax=Thielaviopsis punctulata TaxID=72032 RepID=A0A0F4ZL97_9PEZI|nr:hypothetical protein TD95_002622 [Thielaviopsis punctulata]